MSSPIVFNQTNLLFNTKFIEELSEMLNGSLEQVHSEHINVTIFISGGSHEEGKYVIPLDVLLPFLKEKTKLQCWRDYGYWTQTKVPAMLQEYFTADKNQ